MIAMTPTVTFTDQPLTREGLNALVETFEFLMEHAQAPQPSDQDICDACAAAAGDDPWAEGDEYENHEEEFMSLHVVQIYEGRPLTIPAYAEIVDYTFNNGSVNLLYRT